MIFILFISIFLFGIEITNMIEGEDFNIVRLILLVIILLLSLVHIKRPEAIDVYKGKTTLEITYRDNTPMDSVVVWKK